jgi:hypothetical protein
LTKLSAANPHSTATVKTPMRQPAISAIGLDTNRPVSPPIVVPATKVPAALAACTASISSVR